MMKNLLLLILAAALFFAYQRWQQAAEVVETPDTATWDSERPAGGGPVREWESAPGAVMEHNRQAGKPGMSQPAMRNVVKKGLGQKSD